MQHNIILIFCLQVWHYALSPMKDYEGLSNLLLFSSFWSQPLATQWSAIWPNQWYAFIFPTNDSRILD